MASRPPIAIVAFDMFETLVRNGMGIWVATFDEIVEVQSLPISASELFREWRSRDIDFRRTRTNIEQPESSPPFRTYAAAWLDSFERTFDALKLTADATDAAQRCVWGHSLRPAYSDAAQVLPKLAGRWPMGLVSNADHSFLEGLVRRQGWSFEPMVSSESAQAYKPDPRIFEAFCQQASVAPEQVLFVGDSLYDDVHGAKRCGFQTVWVRRSEETPGATPTPENTELLQADFEIRSLQELKGILMQERKPA